jgi:hypothetical protein
MVATEQRERGKQEVVQFGPRPGIQGKRGEAVEKSRGDRRSGTAGFDPKPSIFRITDSTKPSPSCVNDSGRATAAQTGNSAKRNSRRLEWTF